MKFYPLRNWRSGQPTVLIDGNTYYTLELATEWEITEAEEFTVSLTAHKGEEWIKARETMKGRKPTLEKGQERSGEDREWISKMLAKDSTRIVSLQQVVIVAPTPSAYQDAGTIKLDPEGKRKEEEEKEKEKHKGKGKGIETEKGKGIGKGKGKAPKTPLWDTNRTSPPVTRARKRARQTTLAESYTASQDSCTPRNPLQDQYPTHAPRNPQTKEDVKTPTTPMPTFFAGTQDRHLGLDTPATPPKNNNPFRPSEGYIPPPPRPPPQPTTDNEEIMTVNTLVLVKTALGLTKDIEHETPTKKFI